MVDSFTIDIVHKGKEIIFEAELITQGYLHKIKVLVNDKEVLFEPDEERKYRAIVSDGSSNKINEDDRLIIQAIGDRLDSINA